MKSKVDTRFYKHFGPIPLRDLLDGLDIDLIGSQFNDIQINNAAPAHHAGVSDICYFEPSRTDKVLEICGGSACLVRETEAQMIADLGCLPIISKFPRADFARIIERLYVPHAYGPHSYGQTKPSLFPNVELSMGVVLGQGVEIGAGTVIGPNSVIGSGVKLGNNCKIGANVVIEFATIGANCIIHNGAIIGGCGFGVAAGANGGVDIPHVGGVALGDNVSVGCQSTIDRSLFGNTVIGDGCKFDNFVHIAHNTIIGAHCMFAAQVGIAGSCNIGSGVIMGGKAGTSDHITVGDGVTLAGGALTMHDIPDGEMWSGIPAVPIRTFMRQINTVRKLATKKKK